LRRPRSVRRTTTLETRWPDGLGGAIEMVGRARDAVTPADGGAPVVHASGALHITSSSQRQILSIATEPAHPRAQELVGVRAGGASREALGRAMGDVRGAPVYQMIDDFAGASLVCEWIWPQWRPELVRLKRAIEGEERARRMLDVCTGWAEGSSAFAVFDAARPPDQNRTFDRTEVAPLQNPDDLQGWHEMSTFPGPSTRRARRIDLWADGDLLRVDAGFQDSGSTPDGARVAVHEYRVFAAFDADTTELRTLEVQPLILPFPECPGASLKAAKMLGQPVAEFRRRVIEDLSHTEGCTHLNDVLRSLADAPNLAALLHA